MSTSKHDSPRNALLRAAEERRRRAFKPYSIPVEINGKDAPPPQPFRPDDIIAVHHQFQRYNQEPKP